MSLFRGWAGLQKSLPGAKYFSSEWSFAQFRVPPLLSICAFGAEPSTILGSYPLPPLSHFRALLFACVRVFFCARVLRSTLN